MKAAQKGDAVLYSILKNEGKITMKKYPGSIGFYHAQPTNAGLAGQ
jgi:hypothetical protein